MNVETYDEGMEIDTKSAEYSSNHRNIGPDRRMTNTKSQDYSNVGSHRTKSGVFSSSHRHRHRHSNRNVGIGTHILGVESDTRHDDYSFVRICYIRLICEITTERIQPGSCRFT